MKVTVEDINSVKKVLHIEIPVEKIVSQMDEAYNTLKRTAKIKGFRPGKAPRSVLEKLYKKDVESDLTSRLIQDSFMDAIKETNLPAIGTPRIIPPALNMEAPYCYDATIEIRPTIGDIDFKGLELKKTVYQVTDQMVDDQIKMFQASLAQKAPIKDARPVQDGDFVLIDHEGFKDGEAFGETGKTENDTLKVGAGTIHEDFDKQLVGMTPGETKDICVAFPEEYHNKKLSGLTITFKVALKEIQEEELPVLDDAFAQKLGRFDSLEAFRATVRKNLTESYEKRIEQDLSEQAASGLITKTDFEVPEILVQFELEGIVAEAERSFAYHNMSLKAAGISRDQLAEQYKEVAVKQARQHLILSRIVEQEALTLADDEMDLALQEMANTYRQPFEGFKKYFMSQEDKVAYLKETLLEKKAMKLVFEHAKMNEVPAEEVKAG